MKFIINGNGFHYGRAIASYQPLHTVDTLTKDRAFFIEDVVGASQRPHVYLDPTNSQGGLLRLPFVYGNNALDIPENEWDQMGQIIIHGMQNLKHANGASDSVTVSVFAWAEDVVISTPTSHEPSALVPQAGEYIPTELYQPQGDEYGQGIISKPAATIARAAGALAKAPFIGAYAKATQIGATAISAIASTFGYSRPNDVSAIKAYKPTYMGNMVNTNVEDTCTKLTLDAKQELTCDTTTFGLDGTDEMTIKSIAMRESYLTSFPWLVAETSEALLWNTRVSPVIWNDVVVGGNKEFHMPACCFAALPFQSWRGTMKFRFQIVASTFHKGRLKIVYDPSYAASNEYNTNYTRVIDLAEERDFTVSVGWGQQTPFLNHQNMLESVTEIFDVNPITLDPRDSSNGVLSVYVVNELTVPNSTANNDISINVFVSAGEDFEVVNPTDLYIRDLSWYAPQFGEYIPQGDVYQPQSGEMPDATNTIEENAPMKLEADEQMAPMLDEADHTMDVFYGDPVTSIRQLLKRYNYSRALPPPADLVGESWIRASLYNFPLYRGYAETTFDEAALPVNPTPFNYVHNTWINYFTPAYVCWRGGIRWKYLLASDDPRYNNLFRADRIADVAAGIYGENIPDESTTSSVRSRWWVFNQSPGQSGMHVTQPTNNPALEIEIPFMRFKRFLYGKTGNLTTGGAFFDFLHTIRWTQLSFTTAHNMAHSYVAAGEDYTLGFYCGPPVAYKQLNVIAA